jgi:carboxylate-amine ligase
MVAEPAFTLGVEEEYLLVDRLSRDLVREPPPGIVEECESMLEGQVSPEFLRSQIEVGTRVCHSLAEVRADLVRLRGTVAAVVGRHGLAPIAASTHPFASWHLQKHTDKARYNLLARDIQAPARRLVICGMHVHVGIEDPQLRVDLMGQVSYFLPHLLALSTSSPFWRGEDTGLKSYRIAVFDELPRTGLPEMFESWGEYERHLKVLVDAGLIEDGSKLWWDVRPSARFPTLEMRITDACTLLEDTICIAALYRCLLRMLWRLKRNNQRWRRYAAMLINENRWRAQRYGMDEGLVDFGKGTIVPYVDLLEELLQLTREDAEFFGCLPEIEHARTIARRGTSAHRQLALYRAALAEGQERADALKSIVDRLIEETVTGLEPAAGTMTGKGSQPALADTN